MFPDPSPSESPLLAAQLMSGNYGSPAPCREYLEKFALPPRRAHLITQKYVDAIFLADLLFLERDLCARGTVSKAR